MSHAPGTVPNDLSAPDADDHRPAISDLMRQIRRLRVVTSRRVNERFLGDYRGVFRGQGIEFDEVREYVYGDDVRDIDWNVTARMGHPYLKRYREERALTLMLVIDVSGSFQFSSRRLAKSAIAAELACLLALSADRYHDHVGLLLFSDRIEKYIPPCRGPATVSRLLREIHQFRNTRRSTCIATALRFLSRVRKRPAVVFLISDFLDDGYRNTLHQCAQRHDLIACHIMDPLERALPKLGRLAVVDPENGATRVIDTASRAAQERLNAWSDARQHALYKMFTDLRIDTLTLTGDRPVVDDVHALFNKRRHRRGLIRIPTATP